MANLHKRNKYTKKSGQETLLGQSRSRVVYLYELYSKRVPLAQIVPLSLIHMFSQNGIFCSLSISIFLSLRLTHSKVHTIIHPPPQLLGFIITHITTCLTTLLFYAWVGKKRKKNLLSPHLQKKKNWLICHFTYSIKQETWSRSLMN